MTTTTMGIGGIAEDPLAKGIQQEKEFYADKKNLSVCPTSRFPARLLKSEIGKTKSVRLHTHSSYH